CPGRGSGSSRSPDGVPRKDAAARPGPWERPTWQLRRELRGLSNGASETSFGRVPIIRPTREESHGENTRSFRAFKACARYEQAVAQANTYVETKDFPEPADPSFE